MRCHCVHGHNKRTGNTEAKKESEDRTERRGEVCGVGGNFLLLLELPESTLRNRFNSISGNKN